MQISVIIPTYRPQDYLFHCIDAMEQQTLERSAYEIVIVLNGCCEPYKQQIENYLQAHRYENIILVQINEGGVSRARNLGLTKAKGNFIAFVDDDDWVSPNYLEALLHRSAHDTIANSNVIQIHDSTQQPLPHFLTEAYKNCRQQSCLTLFNTRSFLSVVWGKLIPRTLIGKHTFDQQFTLGEDSLFMFSISNKIKHMRLSDTDVIYYVRHRSDSASHRHHTYSYRVKTALGLSVTYILLFMKHPFSYNIPLFASRVFATLWKLRKKHYE